MTYFMKENISYCQIAGAITEAALEDLRVNLSSFSGFPQVHVSNMADDVFTIKLSWLSNEETFELSTEESLTAAKKFKSNTGYDSSIFDRVQKAIASLEAKARNT